ncbi:MAG: YbjN domain-containing protein [Alphaproteobacteria bacterium]|nr:YbjN domain-containing protein [Alphaproteobacteria bacterium]
MQPKSQEQYYSYSSPISLLEEFLFQLDWNYERIAESEIAAEIEGRWCSYRLFALWKEDLECLMFSSLIDLKIPQVKREAIEVLLSMLNPKLLLGHFEVSPDDEVPAFRYTLTLRGNPGATFEQMEEIINAAITECDRLYPALQFVLWGGKLPEEAMAAAMLDTYGEA